MFRKYSSSFMEELLIPACHILATNLGNSKLKLWLSVVCDGCTVILLCVQLML